jgi:hypothetical protein
MVDRKGKPRKQRKDNTALPLSAFTIGSNNSMDNSIANVVSDLYVVYHGTSKRQSWPEYDKYHRLITYEVMKN